MFSRLIERLSCTLAKNRLEHLPAVKAGQAAIEHIWTGNNEITKDFSHDLVRMHAEGMMEAVIRVAVSPDPRMANREKLTNCLIEMAQFEVLIINPAPAEDRTGLRGQPGITGELKERLFELAQADKGLKEFFQCRDPQLDSP